MKDDGAGSSELTGLQVTVDAELHQADASQDPAALMEPELEKYEIRLHSLRDAVTVVETHQEGLDQA